MPTIYLIGDSTVEDNKPPFRGWGWALPALTAPGVTVKNHALSGRSSLSFREEGLFEPVRESIAAGDLLLVQFGHNDEKDDAARHTDPDGSYPEQLSLYCDAALSSGALPVLVTPVCRRIFVGDGKYLLYSHGEYPAAVRRLAQARHLPLIDLQAASRALYLSLGADKCAELFVRLKPGEHPDFPDGHDDLTHFCALGAERIARLVAEGLLNDERTRAFVRLH